MSPEEHEFPPPMPTIGQPDPPREPYAGHHRSAPAADLDEFGAEAASAALAGRIAELHAGAAQLAPDGRSALQPPFDPHRDHFEGNPDAAVTLLVFGAFGTPASAALGHIVRSVRDREPNAVLVAWRHFPDPVAHPHAGTLALAAEAATTTAHFWALARQMLAMRHDDPSDLHHALVRAGVNPDRAAARMRAGTGADRIVDDVASALSSGVAFSPALFLDDERYEGELQPDAVLAGIHVRLAR
jgi:hypothetical protein